MTGASNRIRRGADVALAGSALGVVAGILQASIGSDIPDWTGAKASPLALGLLTIVLSAMSGAAALILRRQQTAPEWQLAATVMIAVTGLVCFTTVGRLWFVPGPILLVGAALSVESWKSAATIVRQQWFGILLVALGGCLLLMAASAPPVSMFIGALGGFTLVGAAWIVGQSRPTAAGLIALGTVPFAVVAWSALVPILVLIVAAGLAARILMAQSAEAIVTPDVRPVSKIEALEPVHQ